MRGRQRRPAEAGRYKVNTVRYEVVSDFLREEIR